jgi:hypothetical protein
MFTTALSMIRVLWEPGIPASIDTDARRNLIPGATQDAKAGGSGSFPLAARVTERESVSKCYPIQSRTRISKKTPPKTTTGNASQKADAFALFISSRRFLS